MISSKEENPEGFHHRYYVTKLDGETDPRAEYFVLRLDNFGKDSRHIEACRKAILVYAEEIKDHLPGLAADLVYKYSPALPPDK